MAESEKVPDETLGELLNRLGVPANWDAVIVGDGSGSVWGHPIGWASVVIDKKEIHRRLFCGAMNNGTVNLGESMAYLSPLLWYMSKELADREKTKQLTVKNVHVITDSEYVRTKGSSGSNVSVANSIVWMAISQVQRHGIMVHWHWRPRNSDQLAVYVDVASKIARGQFANETYESVVGAIQSETGLTTETANYDD